MNAIPQVQGLVIFDSWQAVTDTLVLAKTFGKSHSNVLRAYDNLKLKCADQFMRRNFAPHEYLDEPGNTRRSVTMTKDGFSMLAMGFTGRKAMVVMEAYLAAFDAMTEHIANQLYRALLEKEHESKVHASFGSHLMIKRKLH